MSDLEQDFLNDDELSKAFDFDSVEPTDEHIERLRDQIALRTRSTIKHAGATQPSVEPMPAAMSRFRVPMSLAAVAAVALIALLVSLPFAESAAAGLRSTLEATRMAAWIHGATTIEHDGNITEMESWCSPTERIVAFRSPQLMHVVDYAQGLQTSYSPENGQAYQWQADSRTEGFGREFVNALLNDGDIQSTFPMHGVSDVKKSIEDFKGQSMVVYSFRVQMKGNPEVHWETIVRTNPDTGMISNWEDHHANGVHIFTQFDYPNTGPHNIGDLGAPQNVDVMELDRLTSPGPLSK